jgi:hypothetical protein
MIAFKTISWVIFCFGAAARPVDTSAIATTKIETQSFIGERICLTFDLIACQAEFSTLCLNFFPKIENPARGMGD